jgi:hypothetical protein
MHLQNEKVKRTEDEKRSDEDEGRAAYARGVASLLALLVVVLMVACGGTTGQSDAGADVEVLEDAGRDAPGRCINDATGGLCDAGADVEVLVDAGHAIADSCAPDGARVFDGGDAGCYVYSNPTGGQCFIPCESK